jgi:hypothetical protein
MYNYRCKKRINGVLCDTRVSLKRKIEDYTRKPRCKSCGNLLSYHDKATKRRNKREKCGCGMAESPIHKRGSKGCIHENVEKAKTRDLNESLNVGITIVDSDEPPF